MKTTWRKEITEVMNEHGDSWGRYEDCTLSFEELDVEFCTGYGSHSGEAFTLWTVDRVYFPAVYDGDEWVSSVPRNPCDEKTTHVGGE